jgi:lipid-A-disaccharide synthase
MPSSLSALEKLQKEFPLRVMMALAPTLKEDLAKLYLSQSSSKVELLSGKTYDLLFAADLGLIGSGTATLESALAQLPMVILARSSTINYWLARFLVDVPFFGLPNLIAEKEICPELFMYNVNPKRIYEELKKLISDPNKRERQKAELKKIRERLGEKQASSEAAKLILEMLND